MRASGRTTGGLLKEIGEALQNPGKKVVFVDHLVLQDDNLSKSDVEAIHHNCLETLYQMIDRLNLKDMEIEYKGSSIIIQSNFYGPKQGKKCVNCHYLKEGQCLNAEISLALGYPRGICALIKNPNVFSCDSWRIKK